MDEKEKGKDGKESQLTPEEQTAKAERWVENRIRLVLGLVERIVFSVCIIAIVVLGERNFWSREMRSGVEPITSIGTFRIVSFIRAHLLLLFLRMLYFISLLIL